MAICLATAVLQMGFSMQRPHPWCNREVGYCLGGMTSCQYMTGITGGAGLPTSLDPPWWLELYKVQQSHNLHKHPTKLAAAAKAATNCNRPTLPCTWSRARTLHHGDCMTHIDRLLSTWKTTAWQLNLNTDLSFYLHTTCEACTHASSKCLPTMKQ